MRTSKPIATISYNSQSFLLSRLNELVRNHRICDWIFINHFHESDESKDHIHLWLKPNTLLDTMDLQEFFTEPDPKNPAKSLKCIDFRVSNVDDWILYGLHLEPYLRAKNESREYHYTKDDFVFCDEMSFEDLFNHALKGSEWARNNQRIELLKSSMNDPVSLILSGAVPLNLACALSSAVSMGKVDRGGRSNHEPDS